MEHEVQMLSFWKVQSAQRVVGLELLAGEHEALLVRGNALLVLHRNVDDLDGVRAPS